MNPCLDDSEMLRLMAAEAGDLAEQRAHLVECPRCAVRYDDLAREADTITSALSTAADSLRGRRPIAARGRVQAPVVGGFRSVAILSGAATFGGIAAFALLFALGWRPASAQNRFANGAANAFVTVGATAPGNLSAREAIASVEPGASPMTNRMLYAAEAITNDPLAGIAYGESAPAANSNSYEDMLFCVPGDDGALCSSVADQG